VKIEILVRKSMRTDLVSRLRRKAGRALQLLEQKNAILSLAFVGNRSIRNLNARYRRKAEPTDVLSFPSGDELPSGEKLLGDVVISIEQAAKQASERGKSVEKELEALLVHGILHLLGYDHERSRKDEKTMLAMERKIRRALSRKPS
jgi:probable rRNA maturation factor